MGAAHQVADEHQVELGFEEAAEVVSGNQRVQRREHWLVHPANLGRAEHGGASLGAHWEREQISQKSASQDRPRVGLSTGWSISEAGSGCWRAPIA